MIIYIVTNLINGKVYVGQTVQALSKRKWAHLNKVKNGSKVHFHNAIRYYGKNNFQWNIVYRSSNINNLNYMEEFLIIFYDTFKNGYNMTTGGNNALHSKKTINKMSNNMQGCHNHFYNKKHTSKTKEKIGCKSRLNWEKPEMRKKTKKSVKKYWKNPETHKEAKKRTIKSWENPRIREKRIEGMKKGWEKRRIRLALGL